MKRVLVLENYRFGKDYLRKAKEIGYETILATYKKESEVVEEDKPFIDHYIQVEIEDFDKTVEKIVESYTQLPFDGVLAGHVFLIPQISAITDKLKLPSFGYEAACNTTYKERTRKILREKGLFPYEYFEIQSIEDLQGNRHKFTYPCIIKPSDGFASINVFKANNFEQLENYYLNHLDNNNYGALGKRFSPKVLVEEFIGGKEYSIESVVEDGNVINLAITEKILDDTYEFVEKGHMLPAGDMDKEQRDRIINFTEKIHKALKIQNGITHAELKIEGEKIGVMEVNPRVGGDYIGHLLSMILNHDMYEIIVRNSVGEKLGFAPNTVGYAGVRFILPKSTGKINDIKGLETVRNISEIKFAEERHHVGEEISVLSDSRGRVVAVGAYHDSDCDILKEVLDNAEGSIQVVME